MTLNEPIIKRTWAEINLNNLSHNLLQIKKIIDESKTSIMCVVKANAYGHDDINLAHHLEVCGIKYFAVSNVYEAIHLRTNGIKGDILILGPTQMDQLKLIEKYDIIQTIPSIEYATSLLKEIDDKMRFRVHLAIDTGMCRIGERTKEHDDEKPLELVRLVKNSKCLEIDGLFTHYSCADSNEVDDEIFTKVQTDLFFDFCKKIEKIYGPIRHKHCLNSAGTIWHYDDRSTLARIGIALYGISPNENMTLPFELKPVMSVKSTIQQIKMISANEYVGYGRTYLTKKETKIAIISIGYADGLPRALSSKGHVIINDKKIPIIGRICMDTMMVDITNIDDISTDSTVTIIGEEKTCKITATELANLCNTIPYEIVCSLSNRVPRHIMLDNINVKVENYYIRGGQ